MNGTATYIASESYEVSNCPGCVYYVGDFSSGKKSGKGTCYDQYGKLLYYGNFSDDKPMDVYPSTGYSGYTFECVECGGGDIYIGEKKDGVRYGYGVYLRNGGEAWYGPWKDGKREGYGILLFYKGGNQVGYWTRDYCGEAEYPDGLSDPLAIDELFTKVRIHKVSPASGSKESGQKVWERAMFYYNAKKYAQAVPLFGRLAGQGNVSAQYYLGGCYYYTKDLENAAKWWHKAADGGNTEAKLAWLLISHTQ